jgi:very-short-patch-repair endonuclease
MTPKTQKRPGVVRERGLAALANRQYGAVGRWQLVELGFGAEAIKLRLESDRLHHIHRESYAVGHGRISQRGSWMAAVVAYGAEALLSHHSAAALWGLVRARGPIDVTAPLGRQGVRRRRGIRLHRCKLFDGDRTKRDGIPVTTVARTLFDLAETVDYRHFEQACEEADRLKLLRARDLERLCELGRGRRALRPVRRLLADLRAATTTRSPLEERFQAFVREYRLPPPATNVLVLGKEVDALWPAARLIAELDSWEFHSHRAAFQRDRARDTRLLVAGYCTIRVTDERLDTESPELAGEIRHLLRA